MENTNHIWQFSQIGGVNRVILESGADIAHLDSLDQKLWTALSCPVKGLEFDDKTLHLVDQDKDGKLRVPDVLAAVKWLLSVIKNPDDLVARPQSMPLSAINDSTPLGKTLLASAKEILRNLGKPEATDITIADTSNTTTIFANTTINGDGVICEESASDEATRHWIQQIMTCMGSVNDRSGKPGISQKELDGFVAECQAYSDWCARAEKDAATILPLGDQTEKAHALFLSLKSKLDDYFLRCRLAEFDPESAETLNTLSDRVRSINNRDISECLDDISSFPIAKIEANRPFSFAAPINPAWREQLLQFKAMLGIGEQLSESDWQAISHKFAAYQGWIASKAGSKVEGLGVETARQFLQSDAQQRILDVLAQDQSVVEEVNNIFLVDQLVRYYCEIFILLNNFVTFADFYSPEVRCVFQAGTLYFDQRSCDLCIRVNDVGAHSAMAAASGICLVYLDCVSKVKNETIHIAAAFTDGDVDDLAVGRNGIFYDNDGLDWDATIVKIVDNPISIRQAFWSPYRKMAKLISKQIEKIAAAQDEKVSAATTTGIEKVSTKADEGLNKAMVTPEVKPATPAPAADATATAAADKAAAKPAPFDIAKFAGIFAAIGLAFGAIGSVLASFVSGFLALAWWKIPLAFVGIILVISGPSMFLAWLKLRKRNLAPILDANGWAINAKAKLSIPFGASLTHLAKLPKNARVNFTVPFHEQRSYGPAIAFLSLLVIAAGVFALWYFGYIHFGGDATSVPNAVDTTGVTK